MSSYHKLSPSSIYLIQIYGCHVQNHLSEKDYRKVTGFKYVNFTSGRFVFQLSRARKNVLLNSHTGNYACPLLEHALKKHGKSLLVQVLSHYCYL
jgi:hypothetical protein